MPPRSVDAIDLRLIRAMGVQPFMHGVRDAAEALKPSALARVAGVTAETVRERLARLEADRVVAGYQAYPNFRLLGRNITSYMFHVPEGSPKGRLMGGAADMEGVVCLMGFVGTDVCTDIVHAGDADLRRKVRALAKELGDAHPFAYSEYKLPVPEGTMSGLDWRIVQALRGRGKTSPEQVAKEIGVSARTVKRRLQAMFADGRLDIVPAVWPDRLVGAVAFILHIELAKGADGDDRRAIAGSIEDCWMHQYSPPGAAARCMDFMMATPSMGEAEEVRLQAESLSGVATAKVLVPNAMRGTERWLDEAIAEQVAARKRPASAEPAAMPLPVRKGAGSRKSP